MGEERILLEESGVRVTTSRIISAGQTFAVTNITSVSRSREPARYLGPLLMILLGLAGVISGGGGALVGALVLAGAVAWALQKRPKHTVSLRTSGGEATAYASHDAALVDRIVEAINQAMAAR